MNADHYGSIARKYNMTAKVRIREIVDDGWLAWWRLFKKSYFYILGHPF